jgi:hypothetical protein
MDRSAIVSQRPDDLQGALGTWAASLVQILGPDVIRELARFARTTDVGGMITVRRTRDGFTAQVTGPIVGGGQQRVTPEFVQKLIREED